MYLSIDKFTPTVQIETPSGLDSCLEFIPQNGYVQVDSSTQVQIKFRPSSSLLERGDKLSVPIKIRVSDQTLPLYFNIIAKVLVVYIYLLSLGHHSRASIFEKYH